MKDKMKDKIKKNINVRRETATKILEGIIERAKQINSDSRLPMRIKTIAVFGSYINSSKDHLGDIDIMFDVENIKERFDELTDSAGVLGIIIDIHNRKKP